MKIPNIFHFCYFGGKPFSIIQYLAIKSASVVNTPDTIYIYIDKEPVGEWWEKSKPLVTIVVIEPPKTIFGVTVPDPAHMADIVRLQQIVAHGGIYLDLDVLCVKPFTPLLDNSLVLGQEDYRGKNVGLCNAVILSEPNANFAKRWLEGFNPETSLWRGFRSKGFDQYYSELSVKYPKFLSMIYAEEITIVDRKQFFYPNYDPEELALFFTQDTELFKDAYCYHLWSNAAYEIYLKHITVETIMNQETTFSKIARRYMEI